MFERSVGALCNVSFRFPTRSVSLLKATCTASIARAMPRLRQMTICSVLSSTIAAAASADDELNLNALQTIAESPAVVDVITNDALTQRGDRTVVEAVGGGTLRQISNTWRFAQCLKNRYNLSADRPNCQVVHAFFRSQSHRHSQLARQSGGAANMAPLRQQTDAFQCITGKQ